MAFGRLVPELEGVVLVGLCDGASAALLDAAATGATAELPVRGVVAINPWIRTQRSRAAAEVKHHYGRRFASAEFWRRLLRGEVALGDAVGGFLRACARVLLRPRHRDAVEYPERMAQGARTLAGRVLWILSGQDLVAREFEQYVAASAAWRGLVEPAHGNVLRIDEADHTFSRETWRTQVSEAIAAWVKRL
jgi:exosortase A-associated hydrolase 1